MKRLTGEIFPANRFALQDGAQEASDASGSANLHQAPYPAGRRSAITSDFFTRPLSPTLQPGRHSRGFPLIPLLAALISILLIVLASGLGASGPAPAIRKATQAVMSNVAGSMDQPGIASGLEVSGVSMQRVLRGRMASVIVNATISNEGSRAIPLSAVIITTADEAGRRVQQWTHATGMARLQPGARIRIRASAIDASGLARIASIEPLAHE